MIESFAANRQRLTVLGIVGLALACSDAVEPVTAPSVASVEVTSPIGTLLDVGAGAQLGATAKSNAGKAVSGVSFGWSSSDPSVVSINATGFIQALATGAVTIRADAGGVGASLPVRVVDADLEGITALATDEFMVALVGATSDDLGARLLAAVADCNAGAGQGGLEAIQDCLTKIGTEGTSDPTDRALLAVLSLFIEKIQRLLNL